MGVIELDGLTKDYGDVLANDDVSFTVETGEIFGYLGPNGAGKTTTIRTLLGLLEPTSGTATVLGADVHDEGALIDAKQRIGYLPAHLGFNEEVTGADVLDYHASVKGGDRRDELLNIFTPPVERPIREYSSGNKRMLGIIQAFMHDPELVIMDEPTSGLDPLKQEEFNEFVRNECERGKTLFFSSHVLSEVRRVCDRVGILRDGKLVGLEDIETLMDQGGKRVRLRTTDEARTELAALDGVSDVQTFADGIQFIYTGEYNTLLRELATHDVREIDISEPPLEDVFMHYYGSAGAGESNQGVHSDA
ncbi:ABC transporter ATP-binding protein [Salinadaptatus halalkaliphilus]|uniref:ABC transporter ATP-binding protein n=1 Tax=Salinadaptatus halalkaliphilus TaxID=2419781 RepID=A0A4S3TJK0_9EURY|nr:ABC transporter ATP-binding protein [Salinadaptatus halalkaliphilus]THE64254.1 ABC transporter ATP-binding protein [Salinadaptatus halalkaliphilus]